MFLTYTLFIGLSSEYGQVPFWHSASYSNAGMKKAIEQYYGVIIQNGFVFQPLRHLNFYMSFGAGDCQVRTKYSDPGYNNVTKNFNFIDDKIVLRAWLLAGYKF